MATQKSRRPRKGGRRGRTRGNAPLYAAVDLGTNNCRLLIAQPHGHTFRVVDSYSQIARLGEGLAATGRLSDASIDRAFSALGKIRAKLKARGVPNVRCIATEACRRAENGRAFIDRVKSELGLSFKIIGPKEEARLALIACHNLIDASAGHVLVLDVGGGSTELSLVDTSRVPQDGRVRALVRDAAPMVAWGSLPLGVVTLFEAFPATTEAEAFALMKAHAKSVFEGWKSHAQAARALDHPAAHIIGTSGTVTCLAGVHLKLDRYRRDAVDGAWLDRAQTAEAVDLLTRLGIDGRAKLPTIGEERASLMLSGCAILDAAMEVFPAPRLRVADRGLREGLLLSMMHGEKKKRRRGGRNRTTATADATTTAPEPEGSPSNGR
ncbi:MAG: Ppx/GppA phosphatase family protein [Pseudomonadota bacterium]